MIIICKWTCRDAGDFFAVLWDPLHYIDLAFKDVFDGRTGFSKEFVSRLVERSIAVHRIFQRRKMLSHATEMAKHNDELVLRLTSPTCSTRFSASQYVEFLKLIKSLPYLLEHSGNSSTPRLKSTKLQEVTFRLISVVYVISSRLECPMLEGTHLVAEATWLHGKHWGQILFW